VDLDAGPGDAALTALSSSPALVFFIVFAARVRARSGGSQRTPPSVDRVFGISIRWFGMSTWANGDFEDRKGRRAGERRGPCALERWAPAWAANPRSACLFESTPASNSTCRSYTGRLPPPS